MLWAAAGTLALFETLFDGYDDPVRALGADDASDVCGWGVERTTQQLQQQE